MKNVIWGVCLALLVAIGVARAATLDEAEQAECRKEGGCVLASKAAIEALVAKAYAAGRERGSISCGNRT